MPPELPARQQIRLYDCSSIPELSWLASQEHLRVGILQRYSSTSERIREAQALVDLHVLGKVRYSDDTARFIGQLRRQGVERDALLAALAQAWLDGCDQFGVRVHSRWRALLSTPALVAASLMVALSCLVLSSLWLWRTHPEIESYLLALPALMGMAGYGLTVVVYALLRRINGKR